MRFITLKDDSFDPYNPYPDKKFCLIIKEGGNFALVTLISRSGDNVRISDIYLVFTSLFTEMPEEENKNLNELFKPHVSMKKRSQYLISVQGREPVSRRFNYTPVLKKTVSVRLNDIRRRGKIEKVRIQRKKLIIDDQLSFEYEILLPDTGERVWMRGDTIEKVGKNKPKPAKKTTARRTSSGAKKEASDKPKTRRKRTSSAKETSPKEEETAASSPKKRTRKKAVDDTASDIKQSV